ESLKRGATDYILKQRLARLVPAVRRALHEARARRAQMAADKRIREQANLLNLTHDAIVVRGMDDEIISWNRGAELVFGWTEQEALGQHFTALLQGSPGLFQSAAKKLVDTGDWLGEMTL